MGMKISKGRAGAVSSHSKELMGLLVPHKVHCEVQPDWTGRENPLHFIHVSIYTAPIKSMWALAKHVFSQHRCTAGKFQCPHHFTDWELTCSESYGEPVAKKELNQGPWSCLVHPYTDLGEDHCYHLASLLAQQLQNTPPGVPTLRPYLAAEPKHAFGEEHPLHRAHENWRGSGH